MNQSELQQAVFAIATASISAGKTLDKTTAQQVADFALDVYDAIVKRLMSDSEKYSVDMSQFPDIDLEKELRQMKCETD